MLQLRIIIASTRPGRKGLPVANWFAEIARRHTEFETVVLDLAAINLPLFDEPRHPMLQKYEHQHTKDWAAMVAQGDAYVIVTPEYNFSFPATIKNALDFVYKEWNYKPVCFVSYGGISAGLRSVQMLKQVTGALKMVAMTDNVQIPFIGKVVDEQGNLTTSEQLEKSANVMLTELHRWAAALKPMRTE